VHAATKRFEIWLKGLFAEGISGASGGILTGLAAVGIDPQHSSTSHQSRSSKDSMPVVGSSAYNSAGQITSLLRSLLNDSQGNLFTDAASANNFVYAIAPLTFSGTYPTRRQPRLRANCGQIAVRANGPGFRRIAERQQRLLLHSGAGNCAEYNWKLKAFAGCGTEITAGAYPASVTTDIVQLTITARKLL